MKKGTGLPTAPGGVVEDEKGAGVSDRTGSDASVSAVTGSRPEQEVDPSSSSSSSSLLPTGELGGFVSASQVYSVRPPHHHHHTRNSAIGQ